MIEGRSGLNIVHRLAVGWEPLSEDRLDSAVRRSLKVTGTAAEV